VFIATTLYKRPRSLQDGLDALKHAMESREHRMLQFLFALHLNYEAIMNRDANNSCFCGLLQHPKRYRAFKVLQPSPSLSVEEQIINCAMKIPKYIEVIFCFFKKLISGMPICEDATQSFMARCSTPPASGSSHSVSAQVSQSTSPQPWSGITPQGPPISSPMGCTRRGYPTPRSGRLWR
jgi:hypothetical protein